MQLEVYQATDQGRAQLALLALSNAGSRDAAAQCVYSREGAIERFCPRAPFGGPQHDHVYWLVGLYCQALNESHAEDIAFFRNILEALHKQHQADPTGPNASALFSASFDVPGHEEDLSGLESRALIQKILSDCTGHSDALYMTAQYFLSRQVPCTPEFSKYMMAICRYYIAQDPACVHTTDSTFGRSALHTAVIFGCLPLVALCLDQNDSRLNFHLPDWRQHQEVMPGACFAGFLDSMMNNVGQVLKHNAADRIGDYATILARLLNQHDDVEAWDKCLDGLRRFTYYGDLKSFAEEVEAKRPVNNVGSVAMLGAFSSLDLRASDNVGSVATQGDCSPLDSSASDDDAPPDIDDPDFGLLQLPGASS